jgi:hypothetical protein
MLGCETPEYHRLSPRSKRRTSLPLDPPDILDNRAALHNQFMNGAVDRIDIFAKKV